ncbi:YhcH/YjgK/YiaL family protein [Georgenia sp. SYP-B2076]|uniref:YhcH/YjgK/YiaL family protein n=1 Tax=Georgenia sp. SYP-B2076 TaxID=2495881 RepID=UPI000F8F2EC1|nr:YhcH/YjgK/YiaL family protein [Georgenia sp. SYP-B2076]
MLTYDSLAQFRAAHGGTKKWDRTLEAIANADAVATDVTYSVGDSLTYRVVTGPDAAALTGHRRYLAVRHVLDGEARVAVAPVAELTATDAYSDLTDRQHFTGPAEEVTLPAGAVLVAEIDEALRDVRVDGRVVTLRVSVEGAFFANK